MLIISHVVVMHRL